MQTLHQFGIIHDGGLVCLLVILLRKEDLVLLHLYLVDLLILRHRHEGGVVHFFHGILTEHRHEDRVEQEDRKEDQNVIRQYRPFRHFDFVHSVSFL